MDIQEASMATSDGEIDSEVEDQDLDAELGVWLDQLNTYSKEDSAVSLPKKPNSKNRLTLTPKQVMDSFRVSILEDQGQDQDLDAILGELCMLETQLTTQQSEISTSMKNAGIPGSESSNSLVSANRILDETRIREKGSGTVTSGAKDRDSFADLQLTLDEDLQCALSELSDLVGIDFNSDKPLTPTTSANISATDTTDGAKDYSQAIPQATTPPGGRLEGLANRHPNGPGSVGRERHSHPPASLGANFQDYSPEGVDSAFSDSGSLPSSGSHVSVGTTSSQQSNSSSGSGSSSSGSSGIGDTANVPMAEQAARLKAEKVRIALEKIKEANIQKLFARFHSDDGCSKSILVDDKMTCAQVLERLVAKNNVSPSVHWAIMEHLPDLCMERLLEDHDLLVEPLLMWTRDSKNKLLFVQSPGKYDIFQRPEIYLTENKTEESLSSAARTALIQEYFDGENLRFPEVEGNLYLKSEGKKVWKKFFFVLRASGLYYCPKGKGKTSKDLICLQKTDIVEVYTAVSWKKKYKAPTDYGFALKHPQVQNKSPKYIKYLCAEDHKTYSMWLTGIRIAKYGQQLLKNYRQACNCLEGWGDKEILPNQNFAEYLAKQNERNQEFAKEHHLMPRQSVCQASAQAMGDLTPERRASESPSVASVASIQEAAKSPTQLPTEKSLSRRPSEAIVGDGTCRRGSAPLLDLQDKVRRPSMNSIDHNQNQDFSDDDAEAKSPRKKTPILPVTTAITRQITDQNAASGTLKRRPSQPNTRKHLLPNATLTDTSVFPPPLAPDPGGQPDPPCYNDQDEPLPPPPPELLNPPVEAPAYSVVDVSHVSASAVENGRVGGSLPNSPHKRPPIYAKPQVVPGGATPHRTSSFSAPQSPAPHTPQSTAPQAPHYATPTHGPNPALAHRRPSSSSPNMPPDHSQRPTTTSSSQIAPENTVTRRPPPPPRRAESTKLSIHADSPQTQYFISDLQRVLNQKHTWSNEMGADLPTSFPPTPPPVKPPQPTGPVPQMDEWLPPPPAELLVGLQQARRSKGLPPVHRKPAVTGHVGHY